MLILPETPRFLIKCHKYEEAKESLGRLRKLPLTHSSLNAELDEIQASYAYEASLGKARYIDCFKGNLGKRLLTGCILQGLQQLTGINFIFYYGTYFFKRAGIDNPFVVTLITNIVNIIATIPGLWLVEKAGRRNLLLGGAIGMAIADFIVAIVGIAADGKVVNLVLIIFVCVFICFFAASWGPVAWVVTGEIYPLKVRAKSLSMTTATNWLLNFALSYCTPYLVDEGPGNAALGSSVFFIWGGFNFIAIIFVYCLIYETKGLTLEEVDELYYTQKCAWRSTKKVSRGVLVGDTDSKGSRTEEEHYEKEVGVVGTGVQSAGVETDERPVRKD
jgi:SP family sugar:H+ symporter-like MFS transporter